MPDLGKMLKPKFDDVKQRIDSLTGVFEVVTVTPLTVYLNGDETTPVDGVAVSGCTYSVGTTGIYLLPNQGQQPWCFPRA